MALLNYRRYRAPDLDIRFWRTSTGYEVDFVLGEMDAAIEVKGTARVHASHFRGLRALSDSHSVKRSIVVCLEREPRRVDPHIEVWPWQLFLDRLWSGQLAS